MRTWRQPHLACHSSVLVLALGISIAIVGALVSTTLLLSPSTATTHQHNPSSTSASRSFFSASNPMAYRSSDVEQYRAGYPGLVDDPTLSDNLRFYRSEIACKPDRMKIDDIHEQWHGDYDHLERCHSYIQWLFPIREQGLNSLAHPLQLHEAEVMTQDPEIQRRILRSYEMMLDFYGMRVDLETGEVTRADNYRDRYAHLNNSFHNYLRITRILKCLGEVGLERYKRPFLQHVLQEIFENRQLTKAKTSATQFWLGTLKNDAERRELEAYVASH